MTTMCLLIDAAVDVRDSTFTDDTRQTPLVVKEMPPDKTQLSPDCGTRSGF